MPSLEEENIDDEDGLSQEELQQSSNDLFARVLSGDVSIEINQRYALAEVQQAHRDLQNRKTTGSTVLLP